MTGIKCFLIIVCVFSFSLRIFPQKNFKVNESNQYGQKTGFWLVYLDERLNLEKDSANAFYKAYNLYFMGSDQSYFSDLRRTKKRASQVTVKGGSGQKEKPVFLEGSFSFYNKKNKLSLRQTYDAGLPVLLEAFSYNKRGELKYFETITYSNDSNEQLGSYVFRKFDGKERLIKRIDFKKENGVWDFFYQTPPEAKK
jgi:hypothetical protein